MKLLSIVLACILFATPALAETPIYQKPVTWPASKEERLVALNVLIKEYAPLYKAQPIQQEVVRRLILCEDGSLNPTQQSYYSKNGVREQSFGLAQINFPAHPDVSYAEATDPTFSVNFLLQHVTAGQTQMWSCAHLLM